MTLTMGTGPFGSRPAGAFNFDPDTPEEVLYLEERPCRVRIELAGETIADTYRPKLLHRSGRPPVYLVPRDDVRADVLSASDGVEEDPPVGIRLPLDVAVDGRVAEGAAWTYEDVPGDAPPLEGLVGFDFDAMDAWYEEDERIRVHPLDPYHRVDVRRSSRHVVVRVDGETVAESRRPLLLFETGLPVRYYLPRDDVRRDVLVESDTTTGCPYKGRASYFHVEVGGRRHDDLVWTYEDPFHDAAPIAGALCFYDEREAVELDVDPA